MIFLIICGGFQVPSLSPSLPLSLSPSVSLSVPHSVPPTHTPHSFPISFLPPFLSFDSFNLPFFFRPLSALPPLLTSLHRSVLLSLPYPCLSFASFLSSSLAPSVLSFSSPCISPFFILHFHKSFSLFICPSLCSGNFLMGFFLLVLPAS